MSAITTHRSTRTLLSATLLAVGLLAGPLMPRHALAGTSATRTGPQVEMCNSGSISTWPNANLSVVINGNASDVKNINYVLHAPVGTCLYTWWTTGGVVSNLQSLQFVADQPPHTFVMDTYVHDNYNGIQVQTTMKVMDYSNVQVSASGASNQTIAVGPVYAGP